MKKFILAAAGAAVMTFAASAANAALVMFAPDAISIAFADGVFSRNLSGVRADGFYGDVGGTSAINGWGQNGEFITFNGPVRLNSLVIGTCAECYDSKPTAFTVSLYDANSALLDSRSVSGSSTAETLVFDRNDVTTVTFTFSGTDGSNPYGDGREVAWFRVGDISYDVSVVPEPAIWAVMIGGFGLAGGAIRRRRALAG